MGTSPISPVIVRRHDPPDSLDFYPTPPWATRALCDLVIRPRRTWRCWEPAAGEGHMAEVLGEYFGEVIASDVHDYGCGYDVGSFVAIAGGLDLGDVIAAPDPAPDWIITNPPFNKAVEFFARARRVAKRGVALLLRTAWLETDDRFTAVFSADPPNIVAVFAERVPMHKGRWLPDGRSTTSYSWFVWSKPPGRFSPGRLLGLKGEATRLVWIPPGQRKRLERAGDRARFGWRGCDGNQITMDGLEAAP